MQGSACLESMRPPLPLPDQFRSRPFSVREARSAGISDSMLRSKRFVRLHRGVYIPRDHVLSDSDHRQAARLALPDDAHLSHASRLHDLGLDIGPATPIHFTVDRDLHLAIPGIFLHRTLELPPHDDTGVIPAAALTGFATTAPVIDVLVAADWLLHRRLTSIEELAEFCERDDWRPGTAAIRHLLPEFDPASASPRETEMRAFIVRSGLPRPEVNARISDDPDCPINDLLFRLWRLAVEYEGLHHFLDQRQIKRDIRRYEWMRRNELAYLQAFNETMHPPKKFVHAVHRALGGQGYDGPPPHFGRRWASLFQPFREDQVRA